MFEITLAHNGDSAEADSVDGALLAAATLVDDAFGAGTKSSVNPRPRREVEQTVTINKPDGSASLHLTALARHGFRSIRDFEIAELRALKDPFA